MADQQQAQQIPGQPGLQTYLIECNRSTSSIDKNTPQSQNAKWTNKANFQLKRYDKVSCEAVMIESVGAGSQTETIEFTGENVPGTNYCDNSVVFEFGFYINNSANYNTLHPINFSHKYLDSGRMQLPATNGGNFDKIVTSNTYPPRAQQYPGMGTGFSFTHGEGWNFNGGIRADGLFYSAITPLVNNTQYIVIGSSTDITPAPVFLTIDDFYPPTFPMSFESYPSGAGLPASNGWNMQGHGFTICAGMGVAIQSTGTGTQKIVGVCADIMSMNDPFFATVLAAEPTLAGHLVIKLRKPIDNQNLGASFVVNDGVIGVTQVGGWSGNTNPCTVSQPNPSISDAQARGRCGIGLTNYSALFSWDPQVPTDVTNPFPPVTAQMDNFTRWLGGAGGWEITRNYNGDDLYKPQETSTNNIVNAGTSKTDPTGILSRNYMDWKSNAPYIMVCPSYQGCQALPNGTQMAPDLMPMTAFVYCSAEETFEDVNNLAAKITEAFHAVNPFLKSDGETQTEILNSSQHPVKRENNIVPYFSDGWFPTITGLDANDFSYQRAGCWDYINPIFTGNLVKCIPANLQTGVNWTKQYSAPYFYNPNDQEDYVKSGGADVLDGTTRGSGSWWQGIYGNMGLKDFEKAYVGDRLLKNLDCWNLNSNTAPTQDCPRPVLLNTNIPVLEVSAPNPLANDATEITGLDPYIFRGNLLTKGQAILTNIKYTEANVALFAELFPRNEKYDTSAPNAVDGYDEQQAQHDNWYYEIDIGMANDYMHPQDQGGENQATNYPATIYVDAPYYLLNTINGNWLGDPPPSALDGSDPTGKVAVNTIGANTKISWICPQQSVQGTGFERQYQTGITQGIMRINSRWNSQLDTPAQPDFNAEIHPSNTLNNIAKFSSGAWKTDPTYAKNKNIGVYPYTYYDRDGGAHTFIGFTCFKHYEPQDNDVATWELIELTWGDFLIWSPAAYDCGVLLPMNGDAIGTGVTIVTTTATLTPDRKYRWNNQNCMWIGANNAQMTFNNDKNRFELGGLYTQTMLSKENAATGTVAEATPQVGEQQIVFNATENTSVFDIKLFNTGTTTPCEPWFHNPATTKEWRTSNTGIEDAQSGVFLRDIWFPSATWTPPPDINLQNYWSPKMASEVDTDVIWANDPPRPVLYGTKMINQTAVNRARILEGLTKAERNVWKGNLLDKCGFEYFDLMPPYGAQNNRFSEFTYGRTDVATMYAGVKPLIQNTESDVAADIDLAVQSTGTNKGTPLFSLGFLNNKTINVGGLNIGSITASRIPTLFACPYYLIISDLVQTQFQGGNVSKNCIFYGLKNYGAGQYFYIYASSYSQIVDQDKLVTEITTEIRNPATGRLAKLSPNSSIIYKIERQIFIPAPTLDVLANEEGQPKITQEGEENSGVLDKMIDYRRGEDEEKAKESIKVGEDHHVGIPLHESMGGLGREYYEEIRRNEDTQGVVHALASEMAKTEVEPTAPDYKLKEDMFERAIYQLIIHKALQELPIVGGLKGNVLNPYYIVSAINSTANTLDDKIKSIMSRLHGHEGEGVPDPEDLLDELRTPEVYLGRMGQIVKRKSKSADQLEGSYYLEPDLEEHLVKSLMHGVPLISSIKDGIRDKEIGFQYKGSKSGGHIDKDDLKKLSEAQKAYLREYQREKYKQGKGGTLHRDRSEIQIDAENMARRMLDVASKIEASAGSDYTADEKKRMLQNLLKEANSHPAEFMRSNLKELNRDEQILGIKETTLKSFDRETREEQARGIVAQMGGRMTGRSRTHGGGGGGTKKTRKPKEYEQEDITKFLKKSNREDDT